MGERHVLYLTSYVRTEQVWSRMSRETGLVRRDHGLAVSSRVSSRKVLQRDATLMICTRGTFQLRFGAPLNIFSINIGINSLISVILQRAHHLINQPTVRPQRSTAILLSLQRQQRYPQRRQQRRVAIAIVCRGVADGNAGRRPIPRACFESLARNDHVVPSQ